MPVSFSEHTEGPEHFIKYRFRRKDLLIQALTHKSYHHENPDGDVPDNERLEFLGDSVLGLAIAEILFSENPFLTEADMSKMKSYLVNKSVLSDIAATLSLGGYLKLGRGEETTGGRLKKSVLADALEAIFGAIFLDSDYRTVKSVIRELFQQKIANVVAKKEGYDFKSELQEKCQGIFGKLPEYRIVRQEGEEHKKIFTIEAYIQGELCGIGIGKSKKEAQMAAAKEALSKILNE
jgi:ribonuclease-3